MNFFLNQHDEFDFLYSNYLYFIFNLIADDDILSNEVQDNIASEISPKLINSSRFYDLSEIVEAEKWELNHEDAIIPQIKFTLFERIEKIVTFHCIHS